MKKIIRSNTDFAPYVTKVSFDIQHNNVNLDLDKIQELLESAGYLILGREEDDSTGLYEDYELFHDAPDIDY